MRSAGRPVTVPNVSSALRLRTPVPHEPRSGVRYWRRARPVNFDEPVLLGNGDRTYNEILGLRCAAVGTYAA